MKSEHTSLYVVCSFVDGKWQAPIKVGTTKDLKGRLRTLQTGSPSRLTYYNIWDFGVSECMIDLEKSFHALQKEHSLSGEWYSLTPWDACFIIELYLRLAFNMAGRSAEEINQGPDLIESIPDKPIWPMAA